MKTLLTEQELPNGTKVKIHGVAKEIDGMTGTIAGVSTESMVLNMQFFIVKTDKHINGYDYDCICIPNTCFELA